MSRKPATRPSPWTRPLAAPAPTTSSPTPSPWVGPIGAFVDEAREAARGRKAMAALIAIVKS